MQRTAECRPPLATAGAEMHALITRLYPICRSITGSGVRETLRIIQEQIPLDIHEVPTGTPVFDWFVPREWNITDAYIKNSRGEKIVDFAKCNLHVMNYSVPVKKRLPFAKLKARLFTIPSRPDWIPYRTSYYEEDWGFCLSHRQLQRMREDEYEVCIESSLVDGHLSYGELLIPGETSEEVLISTHVCHPSLCNDNLSGIAVSAFLARHVASVSHRYSYRFLFIPGTIGAITWLALNETHVSQIKHGLVLACIGDDGGLTYKKSRQGSAEIDRSAQQVLEHSGDEYEIMDFSPYGYDERQYCSPGFNLPVGSLSRTPHNRFPEYHTSADNLRLVKPDKLRDSLSKCLSIVDVLEHNRKYESLNTKCEPHLGRRGLYRSFGGRAETKVDELAMLWVLNLSDGVCSLLDIAERAGIGFTTIKKAADALEENGLLKRLD